MNAPSPPFRHLLRLRHLLPAFLLATLLLGMGLYHLYARLHEQARNAAAEMLRSVATLKSEETQRWIEDRLLFLAQPPGGMMSMRFAALLRGDKSAAAVLETRLRYLHDTLPELRTVWLHDVDGHDRLGTPGTHPHSHAERDSVVRQAFETRRAHFIDIHPASERAEDQVIEFVVPLFADATPAARPLGFALFQIDPARQLFPLVRLWPFSSATAESFLVRQEGDSLVNLTPLRHSAAAPRALRLPLDTPQLIAARALLSDEEIIEGVDYRGTPGLGVVLKVPGTDWLLVSKMDNSEIYAETHRTIAWIAGAGLLLLAAMLALGRSVLTRQQAENRADLLAHDVARLEEAAARARAEETLVEREKSFQLLTEQVPAIIYRAALDAQSQTLYVSPRVAELGYTQEEWLATPDAWERMLHPDDRVRVLLELMEFHAKGGTLSLEYRLHNKEGEWRDFHDTGEILHDEQGRPLYLQGMMLDVTEHRRVERELRAALQVVEASPVVSFRWRAEASWPVDYVSANVVRWGYRPEDLRSGHVRYVDLIHPDDLARVTDEMRGYAAAGYDEYLQEYRLRTDDGQFFWVQENTRVVREAEGQPMYYEGVVTDINEKKRYEQFLTEALDAQRVLNKKLETASNQLLQSEKMASLGQLAAGVAHELNNPIGFVNSNLGTLKNYLEDIFLIADAYENACRASDMHSPALDAARALKVSKDFDYLRQDIFQLLDESSDGLHRVKKIVQDLKDFSRPGETDWQWADLQAGLESTLNIVWNELKYKCALKKDYGELPQVRCLPSQLNQVFMNLLVNAAHAIETTGEIVIATRRLDAGQVQISVSDTGAGIAPEHLNRLFEPFFTTKPVGKGTGLGLSIAWGIIQKHHGRIEVQSELGKGTTFTVTLPIDPPRDDSAAAPPAPEEECPSVTPTFPES